MLPGFFGPWFCSLLFNCSRKAKKQTHLVAHTLPHLAIDYLNKPTSLAPTASEEKKRVRQDDEECWVMILKIGPFEKLTNAVAFLNLWMSKTRGKMRRLERGIELYNDYKDAYKLKMWVQQTNRDECLKHFYNPAAPPQSGAAAAEPFFMLEDVEDEECAENQMSLDALKRIFCTETLDGINVSSIKNTHQKLTASVKKKKKKKQKH